MMMRMFSSINKLLENSVIKNTIYLSILKGTELILPLITFPYLVRVLGPDYFGLVAFSVAINSYFVLLTDYGFSCNCPAYRKCKHIKGVEERFQNVDI